MKEGIILNHTYRILKPIGMGGLGEIYLGYHENLRKYVVIKKVKDQKSSLMNNRIEVDILKSLHHTYLPQVYDFLQLEDGIFTVMEYISGYDLKHYIDAGYQFPEEQLIIWLKQLCEVLDYLHSRQHAIIHCDIKPGNIMITEEGNVCLIDFNISLDGENNKDLVGLSSTFASPEQIKKAEYMKRYGSGDKVAMDERTDIYSLGAVFYLLLSGKSPNAREYLMPLHEMELPYSNSLANIVDKAMKPDPAKRFRSAKKMLSALEHQVKWETEYHRLWKTGIILDVSAASLAILLGCMIAIGYRGMKEDAFFEAYDEFLEAVEADDTEEIIAEGISLLNESGHERILNKYQEEKAELLYRIGEANIQKEAYRDAEDYLEEALEYAPEDSRIYRSLTMSAANRGKIRKAENYLEEALEVGLDKDDGMLLRAEIALADEAYEEAWTYAIEAAESTDEKIAERAAYCVLKVEEKLGNTEECIAFLKEKAGKEKGMMRSIWLRREGELSLETGQLKDAVYCYEEIKQAGDAQLADLYNLVSCYSELGEIKKAQALLHEMEKDYPDEYKIPMRLAYLSYDEESKRTAEHRDYRKVQRYFEEACDICDDKDLDWQDDANMANLQEMVNQLLEQGWLE